MKQKLIKALLMLGLTVPVLAGCNNSNQDNHNDDKPIEVMGLDQALTLAKEAVQFDGTYTLNEYNHTFVTIFSGENEYYHTEYYSYKDTPEIRQYTDENRELNVVNTNGAYVHRYTSLDNKDKGVRLTLNAENKELLSNPMKLFSLEDFEKENDEYVLSDLSKALTFIRRMEFWNVVNVDYFKLKISEGNDFIITCQVDPTIEDKDVVYTIKGSKLGSATRPITEFPHKEEHDELKKAFDAFNKENYTLHIKDTNLYDRKDIVNYDMYRTDKVIYYPKAIDGINGFVSLVDGAYEFHVVNDNAEIIRKDISKSNPFVFKPSFAIAPELFEKINDTQYRLINPNLAQPAFLTLALERDLLAFAQQYGANDLILNIVDGKFVGYEYNYYLRLQDSQFAGHVNVDVVNNGTTVLPSDIRFDDAVTPMDPEKAGIPSYFYGTYNGTCSIGNLFGEKNIKIVIDANGITINDNFCYINSYDAQKQKIIISIDGVKYEIFNSKNAEYVELNFGKPDGTIICYLMSKEGQDGKPDENIDSGIPSNLYGNYKGFASNGLLDNSKKVFISINEDGLYINGNPTSDVACEDLSDPNNAAYSITFKYNSKGYSLNYQNGKIFLYDSEAFGSNLYVTNFDDLGETHPYKNLFGKYSFTLTKGSIDNKQQVEVIITRNDVIVNNDRLTINEYSYDPSSGKLSFTYKNVKYVISDSDETSGIALVLNALDNSVTSSVGVKSNYIKIIGKGYYSGQCEDGKLFQGSKNISVEINEDNSVTINGKACEVISTDGNVTKVTCEGKTYYISLYSKKIDVYEENGETYAHALTNSIIPNKLHGIYIGAFKNPVNGTKDLYLEVTAKTIKLNGLDATNIKVSVDKGITHILFDVAGVTYDLSQLGLLIKGNGNEVTSFGQPVDAPEALVGTYTGTAQKGGYKGATEITIVIEGNTLTINGDKYFINKASSSGTTVYIGIDGNEYVLMLSSGKYTFMNRDNTDICKVSGLTKTA